MSVPDVGGAASMHGSAGGAPNESHPGEVRASDDLSRAHRSEGVAGIRDVTGAVLGAALGLLPHLLHHISLFAGALVISGATGNLLLGALGLLLSLPLLRRLRRRFGTWLAPALAVAGFAALFSFSSFVLGPALSSDSSAPGDPPASDLPRPGSPSTGVDHEEHHRG